MASKLQPTAAELEMMNRALALRKEAQRYRPFEDAYIKDVMDTSDDRQRLASTASADAAQATRYQYEPGGKGLLDAAVTRARGLSRILAAGDQAIEQQALRDRAAIASLGLRRAAGSAADQSTLAQLAARSAAANLQNAQQVSQAKSNFWGNLAGIGLNYALDKWL